VSIDVTGFTPVTALHFFSHHAGAVAGSLITHQRQDFLAAPVALTHFAYSTTGGTTHWERPHSPLGLSQRPETGAQLFDEELRLFPGGKVPAWR